jgi:hypothetical protein
MDVPAIDGANALAEWLGGWPSFHDAEILDLHLVRKGTSLVRVHTWKAGPVGPDGYFTRLKDTIVTFQLRGVVDLELADFSNQNVVGSIEAERHEGEGKWRLVFHSLFGIGGWISCRELAVSFAKTRP